MRRAAFATKAWMRRPGAWGVALGALLLSGCDATGANVAQTAVGDPTTPSSGGASSSEASDGDAAAPVIGGATTSATGAAMSSTGGAAMASGGTAAATCEPSDLDVDLVARRVQVSGVLTVGGEVTANFFGGPSPENALIAFVEPSTGFFESVWTVPGDAGSYEIVLGAGVYDVEVTTTGLLGRVPLMQGVTLDASQSLDLDLDVFDVTGEITLAGEELPEGSDEHGRGRVVFESEGAPFGPVSVELPSTGAATYEARLPRIDGYDVRWSHGGTVPARPAPPEQPANAVPFGEASLGSVAPEDSSASFDISAEVHDVQGAVTLDGNVLADSATSTGAPVALLQVAPASVTVELSGAQPNHYRFAMLAGAYDVSVLLVVALDPLSNYATLSVCEGCGPDEWGDIELLDHYGPGPAVSVSGRVVLGGSGWPADGIATPGARGNLAFVAPPGTSLSALPSARSTDVDDDGTFTLDLQPGTYDVHYTNTRGVRGRSVVRQGLVVDGPASDLELAARVVSFDAEILVNGQTMADDSLLDESGRAHLRLTSLGESVVLGLGETGPARVQAPLLEGEYEIWIESWDGVGRSYLELNSQDVLPGGTHRVGTVAVTSELPLPHVANVNVRRVQGSLSHEGVEAAVPDDRQYVLRFVDADDQAFLLNAPRDSGELDLLLYDGEYRVEVGDTELSAPAAGRPTFQVWALDGENRLMRWVDLGTVCVGAPRESSNQ